MGEWWARIVFPLLFVHWQQQESSSLKIWTLSREFFTLLHKWGVERSPSVLWDSSVTQTLIPKFWNYGLQYSQMIVPGVKKAPCRGPVKIFTFLSETVTEGKEKHSERTNQKKNFPSPGSKKCQEGCVFCNDSPVSFSRFRSGVDHTPLRRTLIYSKVLKLGLRQFPNACGSEKVSIISPQAGVFNCPCWLPRGK
jgi:hypothetical protein